MNFNIFKLTVHWWHNGTAMAENAMHICTPDKIKWDNCKKYFNCVIVFLQHFKELKKSGTVELDG